MNGGPDRAQARHRVSGGSRRVVRVGCVVLVLLALLGGRGLVPGPESGPEGRGGGAEVPTSELWAGGDPAGPRLDRRPVEGSSRGPDNAVGSPDPGLVEARSSEGRPRLPAPSPQSGEVFPDGGAGEGWRRSRREAVLEFQRNEGNRELGVARRMPRPESSWQRTWDSDPLLESFRRWAVTYAAEIDPVARLSMEPSGRLLAAARRERMGMWIRTEPERALAFQIPAGLREILPPSVREFLEESVAGRGRIQVMASLDPGWDDAGQPAREPVARTHRSVWIGDRRWEAHGAGWRQDEPGLEQVWIHGVALDGHLALAETSARWAEDESSRALLSGPGTTCAVGGEPLVEAEEPLVLARDGERIPVCGCLHAETVLMEWRMEEFGGDTLDVEGFPRLKSAYTEGVKRLLLIRVDFNDLRGSPFTDTTGTNLVRNLDAFFSENSLGRMRVAPLGGQGSAVTPTFRMPQTAAWYGQRDPVLLRNDARTAAAAAGFSLGAFAFDFVCMGSVPGYNWVGLAFVGQPGAWIRGAFSSNVGVIAHELGHNLGLNHANFWDTGGRSVVGVGTSEEYGDVFDTMGEALGGARHFNARYKNLLDWIPNASVRQTTTNGIYRVHAQDVPGASSLVRALRIPRASLTNYWVEVRQGWAGNEWMENGVTLRWAMSGNQRSLLLDTTPGVPVNKQDAPLVYGRTLHDPLVSLHVTPLRGYAGSPRAVDVAVHRGSAPANNPPTVRLTASQTQVGVQQGVMLTAQASDPDGDVLAYDWDLGDGRVVANEPVVTGRWTRNGDFVARVTVSDLRGGLASDAVVVRVGSVSTLRASGRITLGGEPLGGVTVRAQRPFTVGGPQGVSLSDGRFLLTGLVPAPYLFLPERDGFLFLRRGFDLPMRVAGDLADLDFVAVSPQELPPVTVVGLNDAWRYFDQGRLPASNWAAIGYDDSGWPSGPAPLGYGTTGLRTTVGFGADPANKHLVTYFRRTFPVADPADIVGLTLGVMRDDGVVVYLNGREVFRDNLPSGTLRPDTRALRAITGVEQTRLLEIPFDPFQLTPGDNVFAAAIHQVSPSSSDIRFALRLQGHLRPDDLPELRMDTIQEGFLLSWPERFTGFRVESASHPEGPWQEVQLRSDPVLREGRWWVEPVTDGGGRHFRLGRR